MEVVYIYMKDYLGLKEKEYNFHEKYNFSYDRELKKLSLEENSTEIPDFFFGKKIISINGIVGENGVGKTRILNFLYNHLNDNQRKRKFHKNEIEDINQRIFKGQDDIEYILILEDNNRFHIKCNLLDKENKQEIDSSVAFYYSNIFDYDGGLIDRNSGNNYNNLSISNEMLKFTYNFTSLNQEKKNKKLELKQEIEKYCLGLENTGNLNEIIDRYWDTFEKVNLINTVKINNDKKQIKFIRDLNNKYILFYEILKNEINIPKTIIFKLKYPAYKNLENKLNVDDEILDSLEIKLESKEVEDPKEEKIGSVEFKETFKIQLALLLGMNNSDNSLIPNSIEFIESKFENILNKLEHILEKSNLINKDKLIFEIDIKDSNKVIDLIEETSNKVEELKQDEYVKKKSNNNRDSFENIIDYSWGLSMSSGEKSMLRLFSLFHEILEEKQQINKIILLVDELDATFHPEWQRKSLDLLVKYLNNYSKYIKSNLTSQLIISSHSPFLVADLPKEKIIALDSDGNQKLNEKLSAFGSNILDIYKENFFLTSTFGEFAKGKIKNVINYLSKEDGNYKRISLEKENEIKFIINSIGEPLIKNKLERMYNEFLKNREKDFFKEEDSLIKIQKILKKHNMTIEEFCRKSKEKGLK